MRLSDKVAGQEKQMKSLSSTFFIVALLAEILTSLIQASFFSHTSLDLHLGPTYYVIGAEPLRLLIWAPTFGLLLAAARFLIQLRNQEA